MTTYQTHQFQGLAISVPVTIARRLRLKPDLASEVFADVREAMGAPREWPRGVPAFEGRLSGWGDR